MASKSGDVGNLGAGDMTPTTVSWDMVVAIGTALASTCGGGACGASQVFMTRCCPVYQCSMCPHCLPALSWLSAGRATWRGSRGAPASGAESIRRRRHTSVVCFVPTVPQRIVMREHDVHHGIAPVCQGASAYWASGHNKQHAMGKSAAGTFSSTKA